MRRRRRRRGNHCAGAGAYMYMTFTLLPLTGSELDRRRVRSGGCGERHAADASREQSSPLVRGAMYNDENV